MTEDELEDALRAWGRCYGEGKGSEWQEDRSLTGESPLAALAGRRAADPVHDRRSGQEMRRRTGTPAWACDPTPARETRTPRPAFDRFETPAVVRIQVAWLGLVRADPAVANVIRIHYQRRGISRDERATEAGIPVATYKANLRIGRAWLAGRLSHSLAA